MAARRSSTALFALLLALSLFAADRARAEASFGDAALTVGIATLTGAVLGASTLPFYENSGDHTQNIFYGAAIGAVTGVFLSAYAGVQDGPGYDDAHLLPRVPPASVSLNRDPAYRLQAERSTAMPKLLKFAAGGTTIAWSPLKTFLF